MHLGSGVASEAWLVSSSSGAVVVRFVPSDRPRPVTYPTEHAIMASLVAQQMPVPIPILHSGESDLDVDGWKGWSVTSQVAGAALRAAQPRPSLIEGLARFLLALHSRPVGGFGAPRATNGQFIGASASSRDGLRARWASAEPWPFGTSPHELDDVHDLVDVPRLRGHTDAVMAATLGHEQVLLHSDLHGEHIYRHGQNLSGVIDFGGAFVGATAWEFAALRLFMGDSFAEAVLENYTRIRPDDSLSKQSQLVGLSLGLYRLRVETALGSGSGTVRQIQGFMASTLSALDMGAL